MHAVDDDRTEVFLAGLTPSLPLPALPMVRQELRADVAVIGQALAAAGLTADTLSGPGLLVLTVPDAEWQKSVAEACTKHGAINHINGPNRFTLHRVTAGSGGRALASDVLAGGCTVVMVDVSGTDDLPADVLRAADAHLVLHPLTWSDCLAVAERLTCDGRPADLAEPDNLVRLTPAAWVLAHRSGQTADEMLRRVIDVAGPVPPRAGVPAMTLSDCPGMGDASTWGADLAADMHAYAEGRLAWRDMDRGALMHGPPGCGKTRFASALAGSAGVPLIASSVSDWHASGTGNLHDFLTAMRAAFDQARVSAPCLLFVDELDAIGLRGRGDHNTSWVSAAVAGLLEALDGADRREGVVVVAATNDMDAVDPALRRSGRLDRCIEVGLPDAVGMAHILRVHLGDDLMMDSIVAVARQGVGGSGADAERWVREARRRARVARRSLEMADLAAVVRPAEASRNGMGFGR